MRAGVSVKLRFTLLGLIVLADLAGHAADWPRFLGPDANGTSPETGLIDRWPTNGPRILWSIPIGTGYSAPSLRGDRLILHHRIGGEEVVECLAPASAQKIWRHAYPSQFEDPYGYNNGPRCSPLLTSNRCYTFGAEGKLVCLALDSGKVVWQRDTQADWSVPPAFFGVGSSPILDGDRLYVMVGGQPNSGVVALDAGTGKTLWENVGQQNWQGAPMHGWPGEQTVVWKIWDKQASYATPVLAQVHGKPHLFCLMRQGLVSLEPATGKVNFNYWFRAQLEESVNAANPVVVGDQVFISAAYYKVGSVLLRVAADGRAVEPVWRSTALEIHWTTPIYHQGYLYAFSGRNEPDARFRCVEFSSGKLMWERNERWQRSTKTPDAYGRGSAILADNQLIVLGEGGLLGMFQPTPDAPKEICRWQVPQLHYPCWAGPVLADRRLYLRSEDRLVCLDLKPRMDANGRE